MKLIPVDTPDLIRLVAGWLVPKENSQWLDFGDGRRLPSPEWLTIAMQRGTYVLRIFTSDVDDAPIGVVGLGNVNPNFKTAYIWVVLGDKSYARHGYATRAMSKMLTLGFVELGLHAISTWIVESNPSIYIAQRLNFRPIGRQRQCHDIDGRPHDRLWFDLLASEHKELDAWDATPTPPRHRREEDRGSDV